MLDHFIPLNMRKCLSCDSGVVEDEFHFLLNCTSLKNETVMPTSHFAFLPCVHCVCTESILAQ